MDVHPEDNYSRHDFGMGGSDDKTSTMVPMLIFHPKKQMMEWLGATDLLEAISVFDNRISECGGRVYLMSMAVTPVSPVLSK